MNSTEIFSIALGLNRPWFVSNLEFVEVNSNKKELHIYLDFERGIRFNTKTGESVARYDNENKRCQHQNFFEHRCYSHALVPRIKNKDGNINIVEVPWVRPGSGFTLMFEAYAMLLIESRCL